MAPPTVRGLVRHDNAGVLSARVQGIVIAVLGAAGFTLAAGNVKPKAD